MQKMSSVFGMKFELAHTCATGSAGSAARGGGSWRWMITNILWFPVATQLRSQETWFLPVAVNVQPAATWTPDLAPTITHKNGASGPNSPQWSHDSVLPAAKGNREVCVWHFSFYGGRLTLLHKYSEDGEFPKHRQGNQRDNKAHWGVVSIHATLLRPLNTTQMVPEDSLHYIPKLQQVVRFQGFLWKV